MVRHENVRAFLFGDSVYLSVDELCEAIGFLINDPVRLELGETLHLPKIVYGYFTGIETQTSSFFGAFKSEDGAFFNVENGDILKTKGDEVV